MGLFTKLKSFFSSEKKLLDYSREEVVKQHKGTKEDLVEKNKVDYETPKYNYKTADEKAKEPISSDERNWVLRFQNQECPYCHHLFEQIKGNRKCPECKNKVIVRTHYQTKEKCILTEEELPLFENKKQYYYDTRWCVRECSMLEVTEKEFYKQWDKMGQSYTPFDVMWHFINKMRIVYAKQGNWGLYRNTFSMQAQNLCRRGNVDQAYKTYLYLAYLDANGPNNTNNYKGSKPFQTEFSFQAPHTMAMLKEFQNKLDISDQNLKKDFLKEAEQDSLKELMELTAEQSWNTFNTEYKKYLKEAVELEKAKTADV